MDTTQAIDTFFKQLPKPAEIKAEIANCHTAIKDHHEAVTAERGKIKRLRKILAIAEAEAGKVVKRGPRKKKSAPAEQTAEMFPADTVQEQVENIIANV